MSVVEISRDGRVGILTLNRPGALNALNMAVLDALSDALDSFEADDTIGAVLIRGGARAFSAGADIHESLPRRFPQVYAENWQAGWSRIADARLPLIAAVNGYALGGGCELAMSCDLVIAGQSAKFGQPEVTLGVIPGMGGTQRLARAVGKAKAADLLMTARMMDADEAERAGLVSRVVADDAVEDTALSAAQTIASYGRVTMQLLKDTLNAAFETSLAEGLRVERLAFHSCFATPDQAEGMAAFAEKRQPEFHKEDSQA